MPVMNQPNSKDPIPTFFRGTISNSNGSQKNPNIEEFKNNPKPSTNEEEWGNKFPRSVNEKIKDPVKLKDENLSKAYQIPQPQKKLQIDKKKFYSKEISETVTNLTKIILNCALTIQLNLNSPIFNFDCNTQNPKLLKKINCQDCGKINILLKLECSHNVCFYCFFVSTKKLLVDKSFAALKACECFQCGMLPSLKLINKINPEISEKMNIIRACAWCKMNLNVFDEFPQELNCGHLCLKCYSNEVYFGITSCLTCEKPFNNIQYTKQRVLSCNNCNSKGYTVLQGFRTLHNDHNLCPNCITIQLNGKKNDFKCLICDVKLENAVRRILKQLINKKCPYCKNVKFVSEFSVCQTCYKIVCDDCREQYKCFH